MNRDLMLKTRAAIREITEAVGDNRELQQQLTAAAAAISRDDVVECRRLIAYVGGRGRGDVAEKAAALVEELTAVLGFPLEADAEAPPDDTAAPAARSRHRRKSDDD